MKLRIAGLCGALSVALAASVGARSYTTDFNQTEDPISEGGVWANGGAVGLDWANVGTGNGIAYGRDMNAESRYDDPTAILLGEWGANQTVQATVHSVNQTTSVAEEVELRLRTSISPHSITGYEVLFRCLNTSAGYTQIVRWNGPLGQFTHLDGRQVGVGDGDVVKATIVGNVITAYINGVNILQVTDNTYSSGSPGIGFYVYGETDPDVQRDYGFTDFSASDGVEMVPAPGNLRFLP